MKDWILLGFLMLHLQKNYPDSKPIASNCGVYGLYAQLISVRIMTHYVGVWDRRVDAVPC